MAQSDTNDFMARLEPPCRAKVERCQEIMKSIGKVVVAFSGGVDSTLVLALALRTLGRDNVLAITNTSATHPGSDRDDARRFAADLGASLIEVKREELANPSFCANSPDRCYHCKHEIFGELSRVASEKGYAAVLSGTNADDAGDYRPGTKAELEMGIRRPLLEAGLTKADIRAVLAAMGLQAAATKPSMACLASRVPYGQPITAGKLARIAQAETLLRELGLKQYRVRDHETMARIEVLPEELGMVLAARERLVRELKALGYKYVSLDLEGFRSGSMNETLMTNGE